MADLLLLPSVPTMYLKVLKSQPRPCSWGLLFKVWFHKVKCNWYVSTIIKVFQAVISLAFPVRLKILLYNLSCLRKTFGTGGGLQFYHYGADYKIMNTQDK